MSTSPGLRRPTTTCMEGLLEGFLGTSGVDLQRPIIRTLFFVYAHIKHKGTSTIKKTKEWDLN